MQEPLVSVNMITYNHEPYIRKAIESILSQKTNFPFELVIGEDCSTDGTREIVFDYAQRYPGIIRVITSNENVGMQKNLYRTELSCNGKYIAYCEGDDFWHREDKLQIQTDYMESNSACGLLHSDYDTIDVISGEIVNNFNRSMGNMPPNPIAALEILRGGRFVYILTCTVMVRREILLSVTKADPKLYSHSDYLIGDTPRWAEISLKSRVEYMNESFATYRVLRESASKTRDVKKMLRFCMLNRDLFMYLIKKHNLSEEEYSRQEKKWAIFALRLAYYERNKELADDAAKKCIKMSFGDILYYFGAKSRLFYLLTRPLIYFKEFQYSYYAS
jgi:glycosyltransferase involved in cell wall biosynthesis